MCYCSTSNQIIYLMMFFSSRSYSMHIVYMNVFCNLSDDLEFFVCTIKSPKLCLGIGDCKYQKWKSSTCTYITYFSMVLYLDTFFDHQTIYDMLEIKLCWISNSSQIDLLIDLQVVRNKAFSIKKS